MTRQEYLDALKNALKSLSSKEIDEICSDFEEHFEIGLSQGKTEHEISAELGLPQTVADTYLSESIEVTSRYQSDCEGQKAVQLAVTSKTSNNAPKTKDLTGARVFVLLFNILIMIWVAIAFYSVVLAGWSAAIGLIGLGISLLTTLTVLPDIMTNATVFLSIALFCFALTTGIISFFLTRLSVWATRAYIEWNKKIYNEGF